MLGAILIVVMMTAPASSGRARHAAVRSRPLTSMVRTRWIIDTDAERCGYAMQHDEVKEKYDLSMTHANRTP